MKEQAHGQTFDRKKVVVVGALFVSSAAILLLGLTFCVFSTINRVKFAVLGNEVPGMIFGVVIAFLGMRYFLSVLRLKAEVYKPDSRFSWSNFKKK